MESNGAKILIVDDDESVRSSLAAIFAQQEYDVTVAGTVADALRAISSTQFNVLISDLHMPEPGDGLTVISAMRHANHLTFNILLSAFPDLTAAAAAISASPNQILVKPADASVLVEMVRIHRAGDPVLPRKVESVAWRLSVAQADKGRADTWFKANHKRPMECLDERATRGAA